MIIKSFSIRSNARRAARNAGLDLATLRFVQDAAGAWTWVALAEAEPAAAEPAFERVSVVSPDNGAAWLALYEGEAPEAEPVEDDEPAAEPAASKAPRRGKSAALVAAASSTAGITNSEIRKLTGWTKFGGFHDAVKRAGLQLRRVREDGDTRWFARPVEQEAAQAA